MAMSPKQAAGLKMPFHLKTGTVVVFEGLDGTGKSTQHERLEAGVYRPQYGTPMFDGEPVFLHMPSGSNEVGQMVYELTERVDDLDPLSRQLLHLASHATEVERVVKPALEAEAVFLDRWWWSTVAYGWKGVKGRLSRRELARLAEKVWKGVEADLIFLFMEPHVDDHHNTPAVRAGYEWLAETFPERVRMVPMGDEAQQNLYIFEEMVKSGIYSNGVA